MLAEELHRKYRADLADAKEQDRREAALVFLDVIVEVSGFEVCSLTVRRYLLLEYLDSPFLGGGQVIAPSKKDVVGFLWVMSPDYRPGLKAARRFYLKNWFKFLFWQKLAVKIAQLIIDAMENGTLPTGEKGGAEPAPDWVATIVDGAASQYSWSEQEIFDLPIARAMAYMRAMTERISGDKNPKFSKHADKVRHWFMKQVQKDIDNSKKSETT